MTNKLLPVSSKTLHTEDNIPPPRKGVDTNSRPGQLEAARDLKRPADLDQRLIFPPEIGTTNLQSARIVQLIELTLPCEDAVVDEAYSMRGRNCGMLIWPLKQNCEDEESRFIQWKWVVEDSWHTLQPGSSETSDSVAAHSKELI